MMSPPRSLQQLIEKAKASGAMRIAVVDAEQEVVIETLREAHELGLSEPRLIGAPEAIQRIAVQVGWPVKDDWIVAAAGDAEAAMVAAELVREDKADAIMKGRLHTDTLMHVLLDKEHGLRVPGRRVSHVFVVETPSYPKLLGVTDAAINITPDLNAKAEILQNAVELFTLIGIDRPKVAVLSAVETVNPAIVSTMDAACLTLMARRGQLQGSIVDGPLAFDNAISAVAAKEKGIVSEVAGDADILLVPDLVSGNILAKNLGYLAGGVSAGVVVGLSAPVVLTSRADTLAARLSSLALASLMFHGRPKLSKRLLSPEAHPCCAPQSEAACGPLPK